MSPLMLAAPRSHAVDSVPFPERPKPGPIPAISCPNRILGCRTRIPMRRTRSTGLLDDQRAFVETRPGCGRRTFLTCNEHRARSDCNQPQHESIGRTDFPRCEWLRPIAEPDRDGSHCSRRLSANRCRSRAADSPRLPSRSASGQARRRRTGTSRCPSLRSPLGGQQGNATRAVCTACGRCGRCGSPTRLRGRCSCGTSRRRSRGCSRSPVPRRSRTPPRPPSAATRNRSARSSRRRRPA